MAAARVQAADPAASDLWLPAWRPSRKSPPKRTWSIAASSAWWCATGNQPAVRPAVGLAGPLLSVDVATDGPRPCQLLPIFDRAAGACPRAGRVRALAMFMMNYLAALAVIEASTRLRRAVYHHTFRLGTLAFRPGAQRGGQHLHPANRGGPRRAVHLADGVLPRAGQVRPAAGLRPGRQFLAGPGVLDLRRAGLADRRADRGLFPPPRRNWPPSEAAEQLALLQESLMLMRLVKSYLMERSTRRGWNASCPGIPRPSCAATAARPFTGRLLIFLGTLAPGAALRRRPGHPERRAARGQRHHPGHGPGQPVLAAGNWLEHRRFLRRGREAAWLSSSSWTGPARSARSSGPSSLPPLSRAAGVRQRQPARAGHGRKLLEGVS